MTRTPIHDLSPYEIGHLFGGPDRVAVVALVALHADGRIRVSPDRHRVYAERRAGQGPVETAALNIIPDIGRVLGLTRLLLAASPAVAAVGRRLRADGLVPDSRISALWQWGRVRRGRALRRELAEAPGGLVRVAVMGTDEIADHGLREIFATHVYTPPEHVRLTNPKRGVSYDSLHDPRPNHAAMWGFDPYPGSDGFSDGGGCSAGGGDGGGW